MIQLWSTWNFTWFLAAYFKKVSYSGSLKSSIVITSLLGGYMIYVYPRKITFRVFKYKIRPSYPLLVMGDIIAHQIPMAHLIYTKYNEKLIENNTKTFEDCGLNIIYPITGWLTLNYFLNVKMDKIYGIKMRYILGSGAVIISGYSIFHHLINK